MFDNWGRYDTVHFNLVKERVKVMDFSTDINAVWLNRLSCSYSRIQNVAERATGKLLRPPTFNISDAIGKWGTWKADTRVMTFSKRLLTHFEWGAVEHVMKHETAHQIVSEIFGMDCIGVAHGEAWGKACVIVGIEPNRCDSDLFLSSFKSVDTNPIVGKIYKLLALSADGSGASEEEAENALKKAQHLMMRYDITTSELSGVSKVFVSRPFGLNYSTHTFPTWMWGLGDFLGEQYGVKCIRTYGPDRTRRLELFGEPDRLDIAEYVGHAIMSQGRYLYERFKVEHNERMRSDVDYFKEHSSRRWSRKRQTFIDRADKISERSFMEGLIAGYSRKLRGNRENVVSRIKAEDGAVVCGYDVGLLEEMYGKAYNRVTMTRYSGSRGLGRSAGEVAGSKMRIGSAISTSKVSGRLLNA